MTRAVLITGASGYVGRATAEAARSAGYAVIGTYHRHRTELPGCELVPLDLREPDAVARLIAERRPAAVLHAGAAWGTPEEAQTTIVEGTRAVAAATTGVGARLIHLSTDVIFDGEHAPYREGDPPTPITFYGAAKASAEAIVAGHPNHVIVRTSLVTCFDPPDPRTAPIVAALAAHLASSTTASDARGSAISPERPIEAVTLFTDEYRCPVRTEDLAAALVELVEHPHRGVLHVAGPERLSRYELGLRVAACLGYASSPGIVPGTVAGSGLVRPRDCTLDIALAQRLLRTPLRALPVHVAHNQDLPKQTDLL